MFCTHCGVQVVQLDGRITDPQQRMTEDLKEFATTIGEMFPRLLKPLVVRPCPLPRTQSMSPACSLALAS